MPILDREDNPITAVQRCLSEELKHRLPGHDTEIDTAVIEAIERLHDDFGGQSIYLHKNHVARMGKVYAEIVAEFNGHNVKELASKYGKSMVRIRQILVNEQKRKLARNT